MEARFLAATISQEVACHCSDNLLEIVFSIVLLFSLVLSLLLYCAASSFFGKKGWLLPFYGRLGILSR